MKKPFLCGRVSSIIIHVDKFSTILLEVPACLARLSLDPIPKELLRIEDFSTEEGDSDERGESQFRTARKCK